MARMKGTVIRSFRIESAADKELQEEAEKKGISVNALVNQIINKHSNFDRYAEEYGSLTIGRNLFRGILRAASPGSLEEVAKKLGKELPREFMNFWFQKIDLETFLSYVDILCKYSGFGSYERTLREADMIIVLHHQLGMEWSILLGHYLVEALKSCCNTVSHLDIAGNTIKMQFKVPSEYTNSLSMS